MKYKIDDLVMSRKKNVEFFFVELVSKLPIDNISKITKDREVDIEVKFNGVEVNFIEFIEFCFTQFDEQVNEKVNKMAMGKIEEIKSQMNDLMLQFMHKNGLVTTKQYSEQLDWNYEE